MDQLEEIKDVKALLPGQTVCNRRNEKGKLCAGPLKRRVDPTYRSKTELAGSDVVYRCGRCYALYSGPPSGFLRDPAMSTFVMTCNPTSHLPNQKKRTNELHDDPVCPEVLAEEKQRKILKITEGTEWDLD